MSELKPIYTDLNNVENANFSFAIITSCYNQNYVNFLFEKCKETLIKNNVPPEKIIRFQVPGANEIPTLANLLAHQKRFSCIIGLGMVIAGETPHHEIIAHATANALQNISITQNISIINGIIVVNNDKQADERVFGKMNRGCEFAESALTMALLCHNISKI